MIRGAGSLHASRLGVRSQGGAALVLIVVALFAVVLMAGLALDGGHMMLSKARLQNTVDAAALSAAKILDETSSTALATQSALQGFGLNAGAAGNQELDTSYTDGNIQVTVQYSSTLPPFTPGSATGPYVRVIATGFTFPPWLVQIGGINQLGVSASAVAGPSPTINTACNVAPMIVCGDSSATAPPGTMFGYTLNAPVSLKSQSPGSQQVGPGNFQLIQLGGTGANIVRQNLAGDYASCVTGGNTVQSETGNETGPTAQGLNTRFGQYSGTMTMAQYPPDVVTTAASPALSVDSNGNVWQGSTEITASNIGSIYNYDQYLNDEANGPYDYAPVSDGGTGVFQRRVLTVPIGDCTGTANGTSTIPILGFGCFFLLQPVIQQGTSDYVIGEFEGNCGANGTPGPNPGSGPGPYVIQLYHNPGSGDS